MAAMPVEHNRRFLTGGGDGTVRMWTVAQGHDLDATSIHLSVSPNHLLQCLAYRPSDNRVFMSHTRHIYSAHLEASKAPTPMLLSACPLQVHIHPDNPQVVILEVCT